MMTRRWPDRHGVAVVLLDQLRKRAPRTFLTEISGTNGLAGAADATLVLNGPRAKRMRCRM
jgi:hypothetical protein